MTEHQYFSVKTTSIKVKQSGALAIYCGEAPRKMANGRTALSMRWPLFIMPPEMFSDADKVMQKACDLLNANAHLFFDSAPKPVADLEAEVATKIDQANLKAALGFAAKLAEALRELLSAYGSPDALICCNGHDCGCRGASQRDMAEHYARAAITEWEAAQ